MHAHLRGATSFFFFRYKGLNKGEEQFCQGVFDVDNRINSKFYEVKDFFSDVECDYNIENCKMQNEIALIYDYNNIWSWKIQPQSKEFDFSKEFLKHYKAMYDLNINVDVISTKKEIDKYKILIIPNMQIITDEFYCKIEKFIKSGKTVIFGYRSGIRNNNNNMRMGNNIIEKLIGANVEGYESLNQSSNIEISYENIKYTLSVFRDILKVNNAKTIINYEDYGFENNSCVIKNKYLNGNVYYFGASMPNNLLKKLYLNIVEINKVLEFNLNSDVEMIELVSNDEKIKFYLNHGFKKISNINPVSYIRR